MSTNHEAINTINVEFISGRTDINTINVESISGRTDYTGNGEYNVNNLPASPKNENSPHCLVGDSIITYILPHPPPPTKHISPERKGSVVNF